MNQHQEENIFKTLGSQQPLSLMTIDASHANARARALASSAQSVEPTSQTRANEDLLTLRILETSERKMQLIKKLLEPDEFRSIAANLSNKDAIYNYNNYSPVEKPFVSLAPVRTDKQQEPSIKDARQISKSETGVNLTGNVEPPITTKNLQENLARKRDALEFFFYESSDDSNIPSGNLAIELRSASYLHSSSVNSEETKVLRYRSFSLIDQLNGLLGLIGVSLNLKEEYDEDDGDGDDDYAGERDKELFVKHYQKLNSMPYVRENNILKMRDRLKSDGQLSKLSPTILGSIEQRDRKKSTGSSGSSARHQIDEANHLAGMYRQHVASVARQTIGPQVKKVVHSVGHFNTIHLVGSKQFYEQRAKASERLLRYDPRIEWLTGRCAAIMGSSIRRARLPESKSISGGEAMNLQHFFGRHLMLELSLIELKLIDHRLMLDEQKLVTKLIDAYDEMVKLRNCYRQMNAKLLESIQSFIAMNNTRNKQQSASLTTLKGVLEWRLEVANQLELMRQQLLALSSELTSLRQQQGFNSTSQVLQSTKSLPADGQVGDEFKDAFEKLAQTLSSTRGKNDTNPPSSEVACRLELKKNLDNYDSVNHSIEQLMSMSIDKLTLTPIQECPTEEVQRRNELKDWCKSFKIRVLIGQLYYYDCTSIELANDQLGIDLSANSELKVSIATSDHLLRAATEPLELKFEFYKRYHKFVPFFSKLVATAVVSLSSPTKNSVQQSHSVNLEFFDSGQDTSAQLRFGYAYHWTQGKQSQHETAQSRCKLERQVAELYEKIFKVDHPFDDTNTKLFKLFNRIDIDFLVSIFLSSNSIANCKIAPYFELDPFAEFFDIENNEMIADGESTTIRQALLMWRWINNSNQPIHLSERENLTIFGTQTDTDNKSRLQTMPIKPEAGYRSIEQLRAWAVDILKDYERKLEMILNSNRSRLAISNSDEHAGAAITRLQLRDLLREPQLKLGDVSGVLRAVRKLVPRPTARRPLMAQRSKANANLLVQSMVGGQDIGGADVESQVFAQWQRFVVQRAGNLQLVVTIQQATNVPMRIVPAVPVSPRPNSPSLPGGALVNLVGGGTVNSTSNYLVPPTTYVEIVFQRRQQASSLAQGKSPAWNETLFFPVQVNKQSMGSRTGNIIDSAQDQALGQSQLVDEFLQLNLYDYHCYLHDDDLQLTTDSSRLDYGAQSTMAMMSNSNQLDLASPPSINQSLSDQPSIIRANRMSASRQRVERHLLGSLRVPLTTLLSSGRIEGSFALNQPLLLENYQFEPQPSILPFGQQQQSINSNNNNLETHISLFITLDPPVVVPFQLYLPTGSFESNRVFQYVRLWEQLASQPRMWHHNYHYQSSSHHHTGQASVSGRTVGNSTMARGLNPRADQHRHIRAIVLQRQGKYCLLTRLINPLNPPSELLMRATSGSGGGGKPSNSVDQQMRSLARFVSLLSPLKYGLFNMRLLASSLWFDSSQLINQHLGGPEEKAVLLCNYFLYLGKCAGLLLGDAIPEGRCVYVIVWREQQSQFIDDQLQLKASTLINDRAVDGGGDDLVASIQPPVERESFISKLPILISNKSIQLWEPNSGRAYSLGEQLKLVSVGSIVTIENVYANIQPVDAPNEINYDIRSKNFWYPLFETSTASAPTLLGRAMIGNDQQGVSRANNKTGGQRLNWRRQLSQLEALRRSIGRPAMLPIMLNGPPLNYTKFTQDQCEELKQAIERSIKANLLKWRPDRPTYFNRTLSRLLADKLALFEVYLLDSCKSIPTADAQWKAELADVIKNEVLMTHLSSSGAGGLGARQVISWPVNLPYTGIKTILDGLFASGIHNADLVLDQYPNLSQSNKLSTQFLVACHVYAYPARLMSVWLYVAAVITQNSSQRIHLT